MLLVESQELMGDEVRVKVVYNEKSYISGIVYKNDELYINYFYVEQKNRGKGIGSQLLKEIISVSKQYNIEKVLLTDESAHYRKKRNIYIKFGFRYVNLSSNDNTMCLKI